MIIELSKTHHSAVCDAAPRAICTETFPFHYEDRSRPVSGLKISHLFL